MKHGPYACANRVKFWQLGNETSYGTACFRKDDAMAATIEFAKAMRARDASLKLIGWGDNGWASDLVERAGEYLDYGRQGVMVKSLPTDLDVAASRTDNRVFLHVANMNFSRATDARFAVDGMMVVGGRVLEIAPENPRQEISPLNPDVFKPTEHKLATTGPITHRFPARSVSVVELECRAA